MKFINPSSPYRESLEACVKEGVTAEIVIKALDYYLVPFALFLGASPKEIGLMAAIPQLFSSLALLLSPQLVLLLKNKTTVLFTCVGLQAVVLFPLCLLSFLRVPASIMILIILITTFRLLGTLMGPPWGSLVSSYMPQNERGRYFAGRSRLIGAAGLTGSLLWGSLLSIMQHASEAFSYFILFFCVFFSRYLSFRFIQKMKEIEHLKDTKHHHGNPLSIFKFFKNLNNINFLKFISYTASVTFATQLALPYFSLWLKRDLQLNYMLYTAVLMVSALTGILSLSVWGRHSDLVGNAKILRKSGLLISMIPLLWALVRNHPLLLLLVESFSGFAWAGFNLCVLNFVYDASPQERRINFLVYFNLINGLAGFAGATAGGFLADALPPFLGYRLVSLFLLSAALRLSAELIIARHFSEVRKVHHKVSGMRLFLSMLGIQPLSGRSTLWEEMM